MSLLMDALKKAEKAKQASADRGGAPLKRESSAPASSASLSFDATQGLPKTRVAEPSGTDRPMEDLGDPVSPALEMDLSEQTEPPLMKRFDGDQAMNAEPDTPPCGLQQREAPCLLNGCTPYDQRARAENMFRIKQPVPPKRGRRALWGAVLVFLLLVISGQGYRFWSEHTRPTLASTSNSPFSPMPFLPPRPDVVAQAVLSGEGTPDRSSTKAGVGATLQNTEALSAAEVVSAPEVASHPSGKARELQVPPLPPREERSTPRHRGDAAQGASKMPTDIQSAALSDPFLPSRRETVPSGMVEILRSTKRDPVNEQVLLAYEAFVRKDFQDARQGYMKALDSDPNNRDALAGLAAIAVVFSRPDEANRIYARMLERDPMDAVAQAGLLASNTNTPENEARIKTLLGRQPGAHFLHFALANQYVAESRWPEAQQAFFDAFRLDPENPDYAFNLAVSLEHLRQPRLAAEHYQRALNLSERRPSAFDQNTAKLRLAQLNGANRP